MKAIGPISGEDHKHHRLSYPQMAEAALNYLIAVLLPQWSVDVNCS
jgi:hypothetical protein